MTCTDVFSARTALFDIANNFAIRRHNDKQRSDYDPVFLDWIFWWWCLATIDLSDKLLNRADSN